MENNSIWNKQIDSKKGAMLICLIITYMYYYLALYLFDISEKIYSLWGTRWFIAGLYILIIIPVIFVRRKWGIYEEAKVDFKNYKQYIYGVLAIIPYYLINAVINGVGFSFSFLKMSALDIAWCFLYYAIIVSVCEEYVFRLFFQGELTAILGKCKWLAPVIASALFALAHIPQGNIEQVYLAFGAGLLMGYLKLFVKNYTFVSLLITHGLYDFLIVMLL